MSDPGSRHLPSRLWTTSAAIVVIAFWTVVVLHTREYAIWKISLREYFDLENAKTERNIAIVRDVRLLKFFMLYSVLVLGAVPVILQRLFSSLNVGLIVLMVLFVPCVWYGLSTMHIAGKMVDWGALLEVPPDR